MAWRKALRVLTSILAVMWVPGHYGGVHDSLGIKGGDYVFVPAFLSLGFDGGPAALWGPLPAPLTSL